jgi:hypothetical protein
MRKIALLTEINGTSEIVLSIHYYDKTKEGDMKRHVTTWERCGIHTEC